MPIYRRGKVWWYAITMKGKAHRGTCRTEDEQQAQEFHDRLKAEIWRGRVVGDRARHTVQEAIERFLKEHEHKRSAKDDCRIANWWLEKFSTIGVKFLEDVKPDVIRSIRDAEVGRKTIRGPIKPATVNRKVAFLRSVVNAAAKEWEWMEAAPKFRLLPGEVERRRFRAAQVPGAERSSPPGRCSAQPVLGDGVVCRLHGSEARQRDRSALGPG